MKQVYLDYNATTPMDESVIEVMRQNMLENYGNPSSVHSCGGRAKAAIEEARERIAAIIGADPSEMYFTSGGTEADNLALKGAAWSKRRKGVHLITSKIEHHAILESAHFMERVGFNVTYLNCNRDGVVSVDELRQALKPDTTVVSVMLANNETGVIQPIREMAAICREAGVLFHTDAVQGLGKMEVNVKDLDVDMLSLSAHKFYGPKGIGALYIRKGVRVMPVLHGGSHERHKRAGTENTPAIVGMARALELADAKRESEHQRLTELSDYFIDEVIAQVGEVNLNGSRDNRIPSTVNLSFKGVEGEAIILSLDLKGIAVSSGSACASGTLMASHVLAAMDIDPLLAQGSIRFSMGRQTTREQLEYTISVLPDIINRLRNMSAAYNQSD
ncbi:MAG: cysteine desulfurase [FCB group bacterium]|nr:cysteine desulfurase [FCB group bacterium]